MRAEDTAPPPSASPSENEEVGLVLSDVVQDRIEHLVAHVDAGGRVGAELFGPTTQLAEVVPDLAHVGPVDRVDREGWRHFDDMEEGEFRVLDLGDQRAESNERDALEVLDRKPDPVPRTDTRIERFLALCVA